MSGEGKQFNFILSISKETFNVRENMKQNTLKTLLTILVISVTTLQGVRPLRNVQQSNPRKNTVLCTDFQKILSLKVHPNTKIRLIIRTLNEAIKAQEKLNQLETKQLKLRRKNKAKIKKLEREIEHLYKKLKTELISYNFSIEMSLAILLSNQENDKSISKNISELYGYNAIEIVTTVSDMERAGLINTENAIAAIKYVIEELFDVNANPEEIEAEFIELFGKNYRESTEEHVSHDIIALIDSYRNQKSSNN